MKKSPVYKKLFTRNFSLAIMEIWYRAEALNDKVWMDKKQPFQPFIVFQRKEEGIAGYYDERGIKWVKKLLIQKINSDPHLIKLLAKKFQESADYLKRIARRKRPLNHLELIEFLERLEGFWIWFESLWWIWEMTPKETAQISAPEYIYELRKTSQGIVPDAEEILKNSLALIFPKLKKYHEVFTVSEIKNKEIPNKTILEARLVEYFFTDNKLYVRKNSKFIEKKYGIRLVAEVAKQSNSLKGQVAYKGKVTGVVKIVYGKKQIEKVKKGNVLVSPMTLPDIMLAIRDAAAIITDEGGIMCHAAIISRELKKPCIVGTKFATQVFKDGDMVEVDANKGIVRKL